MGMVNKEDLSHGPAPEETPVTFATDSDIDTVLAGMNEEKQPFEQQEIREELFELEPEEPEISQARQRRGYSTARFFVKHFDNVVSNGFAHWAHAENTKEFRAETEDIDEMAQYWGEYFATQNLNMPPWAMALIVTTVTIEKKFVLASKLRRDNMVLETERKARKVLQAENEHLKKEIELAELREENEKLKKKANVEQS